MTADELAAVPTGSPEEDGWEAPIPLSRSAVPPFPLDSLPAWLAAHVCAVASALQVPPDLPACMDLATCSTAVAGKVVIEVKPEYREPLNLWLVCALGSGNRKSATVRASIAPIVEWEREQAEAMRDEIAEATSRVKIREGALQRAERSASAATGTERLSAEAEAYTVAREVAHLKVPHAPRLLADDVTAERLATLLMEHDGRLAIMSPEGDVFDLMGGRYSNNIPNIGVYLRAHTGDPIKVDRTGRAPDYVEAPALVMGISPQPDVLRGLTEKPGFRGRGLLARFLYSVPESLVGKRNTHTPALSVDDRAAYAQRMRRLLGIHMNRDEAGHEAPHVLRLSDEARALHAAFEEKIEPQLGLWGELGSLADWGGKLAGAVARLAGVLHLAAQAEERYSLDDGVNPPVSGETMRAALRLASYFMPHTQAAFGEMGSDATHDAAKHVLDWIERTELTTFSARDCWVALHRHFDQREQADAALTLLCTHGYLRERCAPADEARGRGRPASAIYDVNPLEASQKQQKPQKSATNGNFVDFVDFVTLPEPSANGHAAASASVVTGDGEEWETF